MLDEVYNALVQGTHNHGMLMESAAFQNVDEYYNHGEHEVGADLILEAIVIDRFSRTEKSMAAVVRVLNKHLKGKRMAREMI